MARSYRPVVRDQVFLLPPDMAEWLPADHLVWFVLDVVEQLDTAVFHVGRRTGGVGRAGYDPDMLVALLVYAYAVGERSSRRIERLCVEHVAFRVICAQDGPDHSTVSRFRAAHREGFIDLFSRVLQVCAAAGMVRVGVVALDGTKIAANAARSANRSEQWVREHAALVAAEAVTEAEIVDADEQAIADRQAVGDGGGGADGDRRSRGGRAGVIARAIAEVERRDAEHAVVDAVDRQQVDQFLIAAEAGPVRGKLPAGLDRVAYQRARIRRFERLIAEQDAVRGAVASSIRREARKGLVGARKQLARAEAAEAAGQIDRRGRDRRRRERRAARARERGGIGDAVNVTDPDSRLMTAGSGGGSVQGYNAQVVVTDDHLILGVHISQEANDARCYTPTLKVALTHAASVGKSVGVVLADAGYFTAPNLTAAGPDRLIAAGKNREVFGDARAHPVDGPVPDGLGPLDAMRFRLRQPANIARYKRRSATVETVIAHLKDRAGLRRFSGRGLEAVTAELHLAAAALNLARLHTVTLSRA